MVRPHGTEPGGGVASRQEDAGCDEGDYDCRRDSERSRPPKERALGFRLLLQAADGWELLAQTIRRSLVEADGPVDVLQTLLAEVTEKDLEVLLVVLEHRLRRLGGENLAAVAGTSDPCRAMHRETGVTTVGGERLAGVEAHPDVDLDAVGPVVSCERELCLDRREQRVARAREGDEERVALGVDLVSAVRVERRTQQSAVI